MKKSVFYCFIFDYSYNLGEKPLKRGVFRIFRGDATICGRRDPDFRDQRPKKHKETGLVWVSVPRP